jgi:hypothetical protein
MVRCYIKKTAIPIAVFFLSIDEGLLQRDRQMLMVESSWSPST